MSKLRHHERAHTGQQPAICTVPADQRPYKCSGCGKALVSVLALRDHEQLEVEQRHYTQARCDRTLNHTPPFENPNFKSFERLVTRHGNQWIHSSQRLQECGECDQASRCLRDHQQAHTESKPQGCAERGQTVAFVKQLRHDTRARPFTCSQCGLSFDQPHQLKQHQEVHSTQGQYTCGVCGKDCTSATGLERHSRVHGPGMRPFTRGQAVSQTSTHQRHKCLLLKGRGAVVGQNRGQSGGLDRGPGRRSNRSHSCSQCDVAFGEESRLMCHPGDRPFECADCGKAFTRLRGLQDHRRIHTGERPFLCIECGKSFTRMSALRVHLQVHGGDRPYQCSLCGMKFAFGSRLRRHMRTHTGERPYVCTECGVAFAQSSNLKDHQRSHSGEKPHACRECGRAFVSSSTLVKHLRTHTGEKPYRCDLCRKSFTQSSTLKRHKCPATQQQQQQMGVTGHGSAPAPEDLEKIEEEILCICECGKSYVKRQSGQPQQCPHITQGHCKGKDVS
ncbi:zinc finger protein 135-like [Heterodontus francisci]|uniref:zinc finger protein 135-like n=1 Tax=Heterodontus francisci TaxID=7792 RepID=UPI00355B1FC5